MKIILLYLLIMNINYLLLKFTIDKNVIKL